MSTTKNGRIRKLINKILASARKNTQEMSQPHAARTMSHTVKTKNKETGEITKTVAEITIYDNTYGRINRRKEEIKRLETALGKRFNDTKTSGFYYETPPKKPRMRKFMHKKQQAKVEKAPKKGKNKK